MRLLLDAHLSARKVAAPLRKRGHDVRAVDEERALDGATDEDLLALSAAEGRVLVTMDVGDFPLLTRRWAEEGRGHAGCCIIFGLHPGDFGAILRAIDRALLARPDDASWRDYAAFVSAGSE